MPKKDSNVINGTGRRKCSIARVRIMPGKGKMTINGQDMEEYLPTDVLRVIAKQPLTVTGNDGKFDVIVKVTGGGFSGQTGAIRLGITRALLEFDAPTDQTREDSYRHILKNLGLITRDARVKERKKYGLKKARRAPQFSKR